MQQTDRWEVRESRQHPGVWHVEYIDHADEGQIHMAVFTGPEAKERALEYAGFKNWRRAKEGPIIRFPDDLETTPLLLPPFTVVLVVSAEPCHIVKNNLRLGYKPSLNTAGRTWPQE